MVHLVMHRGGGNRSWHVADKVSTQGTWDHASTLEPEASYIDESPNTSWDGSVSKKCKCPRRSDSYSRANCVSSCTERIMEETWEVENTTDSTRTAIMICRYDAGSTIYCSRDSPRGDSGTGTRYRKDCGVPRYGRDTPVSKHTWR